MNVKYVLNREVKNALFVFKRVKAKNVRRKQKIEHCYWEKHTYSNTT